MPLLYKNYDFFPFPLPSYYRFWPELHIVLHRDTPVLHRPTPSNIVLNHFLTVYHRLAWFRSFFELLSSIKPSITYFLEIGAFILE
jgi:hypothetical protein